MSLETIMSLALSRLDDNRCAKALMTLGECDANARRDELLGLFGLNPELYEYQ